MKNHRILVVDDDDHVREALVDELSTLYRVEAVASGGEAFDALATQQYDVVISDLKMPDHDGIEVLEFARLHQRDVVRVLLTGYLDERAHRALLSPDAPYKVGKPWHDEIEVVVQRALEQREVTRRLSASVEDALALATFDDELRRTTTPMELCETVVRRALTVEGVLACTTIARSEAGEHTFIGGQVSKDGPGWYLDLPLDGDGDLRVHARGIGDGGRQLVSYLAHRAQRFCGVLEARVSSVQSAVVGGQRVNHLMRQATLGALTSSLLHDLASTVQALAAALGDLTVSVEENDPLMIAETAADARAAGEEIVQLFVQMRRFIRDGEVATKSIRVSDIVHRATRLAGGYVRERARLRVGDLPDASVAVSEPLFLQVLANLLRNAANASPTHGVVDLKVTANEDEVVFTVTDDGPGVSPLIADQMFEAFASATTEGTGLGLAISAYVMQLVGGRIAYRRASDRGACFTVSLPRSQRLPSSPITPINGD